MMFFFNQNKSNYDYELSNAPANGFRDYPERIYSLQIVFAYESTYLYYYNILAGYDVHTVTKEAIYQFYRYKVYDQSYQAEVYKDLYSSFKSSLNSW